MNKRLIEALLIFMLVAFAAPAFGLFTDGNYAVKEQLIPAGKARAEIVKTEQDLLGGERAEGRIGDFKLFNNRVGFIISGVRQGDGYASYGGEVEDAGMLRKAEGGMRWRNNMGNAFLVFFKGDDALIGSRLFEPLKAEILKDGSAGEAVVRVYGRDAEFPVRMEMFMRPSVSLKLDIIVDYILRPEASSLEVKITIPNKTSKNVTLSAGFVYMLGDRVDLFGPEYGFNLSGAKLRDMDMISAGGPAGIAYGWFVKGADVKYMDKVDILTFARMGKIKAPAGGEGELTYNLAVGGDIASVYETKYKTEEINVGIIAGKCLTRETGKPAQDAVVHVLTQEGKYLNQASVQTDGSFRIAMPAGDYVLRAASYHRDDAAPVNVKLIAGKTSSVKLFIDAPALIEFEIKDDKGSLIPATISLVAIEQKASMLEDAKFGTDFYKSKPFYQTRLTKDGKGVIGVRPGRYDAYFMRGVEYEYIKRTLTLESSKIYKERPVLIHAVDTSGWISADFHTHALPSHDSSSPIEDRLISCAAVGVKVIVASDHDHISDYEPIIHKLGLEHYVNAIIGDENTTKRFGHFNGYPLKLDLSKRNNGAPETIDRTVPEIIKSFRDLNPGKRVIVQLNHPRDKMFGYFDKIAYDSKTGEANDKTNYSEDFDAMEIMNSYQIDMMKKQIKDWFSFLNRGKRVVGLGNSDSHGAFSSDIASPRNYIKSPVNDPSEMNEDDIVKALLEQKVVVSGGPFIRFGINGKGPGELAEPEAGIFKMNVEVDAPSWMPLDSIAIYENGVMINKIPLYGETSVVRYSGDLTLKPAKDAWYIVAVFGSESLFPVYPENVAFSFTNPVYIDANADGEFSPLIKK
ncbi:MAG: CehA/McbA family metallohydrolase [bacterium]